jgi:hypothetical protein
MVMKLYLSENLWNSEIKGDADLNPKREILFILASNAEIGTDYQISQRYHAVKVTS